MICRKCAGPTCIPSTRYPEHDGAVNRRAVRRRRKCLNALCGFQETTLELPEHRVVIDAGPRRKKARPRR